ncbi:MAG: PASTA domain-containing protein [Candidatus Rifleibacteriota bacterium]
MRMIFSKLFKVNTCVYLMVIFLTLGSTFFNESVARAAEKDTVTWKITVIKAEGLDNTDWGPRGVSDPYVKVFLCNTSKFFSVDCLNNFLELTTGVSEIPHLYLIDQTKTVKNSLNPEWNYVVKEEHSLNQKFPFLTFEVWDQDPIKDKFLGIAALSNIISGKTYELNLKRRLIGLSQNLPGKRRKPGKLFVKFEAQYPKQNVPSVKRKTEKKAEQILANKGFKVKKKYRVKSYRFPLMGRVISQSPGPGKKVDKGSVVTIVTAKEKKYAMPDLIGKKKSVLRRLLGFKFHKFSISYKEANNNIPRKKWMTVCSQSPEAGSLIKAGSKIEITLYKPADDFKITIPDVVGKIIKEAYQSLRRANVPGIKVQKQEVSTADKNGKIVKQNPEADTQISWKNNENVEISVGWYADGSSIHSATLTEVDSEFENTFTSRQPEIFRGFNIEKPGYLFFERLAQPDHDINPLLKVFKQADDNNYESIIERRYFFPAAVRVSSGKYVVKFDPEWEVESDHTYRFKVEFFEEFDFSEPNNNFETAVVVEPDSNLQMGFAGAYDEDYYKISIEEPGYLEIVNNTKLKNNWNELPGSKVGVVFEVFNNNKEQLFYGPLPGAVWLDKGEYYVKFAGEEEGWNFQTYNIDLNFHPARDKGEENNSLENAFEVKAGYTIPVAYHVRDKDFYHVKSDEPGYLVLNHETKLPFTAMLKEYDKENNKQLSSEYLPAAVRITDEKFVSINPDTYETGYLVDQPIHLNFGFVSCEVDPFEPNDSQNEAKQIELNKRVSATLLPRSDKDWFKVRSSDTGILQIEVISPEDMPGELVPHLPVVGSLIEAEGGEEIKKLLRFPVNVEVEPDKKYLIQLRQESGLRRLCLKQYGLIVRDGSIEESGDEKLPQQRYFSPDESQQDCIKKARKAYELYLAGEYEKADELYRICLDCMPDNAVLWNDYGANSYKLGNLTAAETGFNTAIELDSSYALPWRNLAVMAWDNENMQIGLKRAEKAADLQASDENLRYAAHGCVLAAKGQKGHKKIRLYRKALKYYKKLKKTSEKFKQTVKDLKKVLKGH